VPCRGGGSRVCDGSGTGPRPIRSPYVGLLPHGVLLRGVRNTLLLDYVAAVLRAWGGLYVVGGDWQNDPADLRESGFADWVRGDVWAPEGHTCSSGTTIDYFLVDRRLRGAVRGTAEALDWLPRVHRPVYLDFAEAFDEEILTVLVRPRPFPHMQPFGPERQPVVAASSEEFGIPRMTAETVGSVWRSLTTQAEALLLRVHDLLDDAGPRRSSGSSSAEAGSGGPLVRPLSETYGGRGRGFRVD
jgi:hypothetical protein